VSNLCWGTSSENHADKVKHGTDSAGERNLNSKLTEQDVMEIRDLLAGGPYFQWEIAEMYGITQGQVSHIRIGKTWKCN